MLPECWQVSARWQQAASTVGSRLRLERADYNAQLTAHFFIDLINSKAFCLHTCKKSILHLKLGITRAVGLNLQSMYRHCNAYEELMRNQIKMLFCVHQPCYAPMFHPLLCFRAPAQWSVLGKPFGPDLLMYLPETWPWMTKYCMEKHNHTPVPAQGRSKDEHLPQTVLSCCWGSAYSDYQK